MTRQKRIDDDVERRLAEAWKDATVNRWQRFGWEDGDAIVTRRASHYLRCQIPWKDTIH